MGDQLLDITPISPSLGIPATFSAPTPSQHIEVLERKIIIRDLALYFLHFVHDRSYISSLSTLVSGALSGRGPEKVKVLTPRLLQRLVTQWHRPRCIALATQDLSKIAIAQGTSVSVITTSDEGSEDDWIAHVADDLERGVSLDHQVAAWSHDHSCLALACADGTVVCYAGKDGLLLADIRAPKSKNGGGVAGLAFLGCLDNSASARLPLLVLRFHAVLECHHLSTQISGTASAIASSAAAVVDLRKWHPTSAPSSLSTSASAGNAAVASDMRVTIWGVKGTALGQVEMHLVHSIDIGLTAVARTLEITTPASGASEPGSGLLGALLPIARRGIELASPPAVQVSISPEAKRLAILNIAGSVVVMNMDRLEVVARLGCDAWDGGSLVVSIGWCSDAILAASTSDGRLIFWSQSERDFPAPSFPMGPGLILAGCGSTENGRIRALLVQISEGGAASLMRAEGLSVNEILARRINGGRQEEALDVARRHGISSDEVHKAFWLRAVQSCEANEQSITSLGADSDDEFNDTSLSAPADVVLAAVSSHLELICDYEWVVKQALTVRPSRLTSEAAEALLQLGLHRVDNLPETVQTLSSQWRQSLQEALALVKTCALLEPRAVAESGAAASSLLHLPTLLSPGGVAHTARSLAVAGCSESAVSLLLRHGDALPPAEVLDVLSLLPETTNPARFAPVLAQISSRMPLVDFAVWCCERAEFICEAGGSLRHALSLCDIALNTHASQTTNITTSVKVIGQTRYLRSLLKHLHELTRAGRLDRLTSLVTWRDMTQRERCEAVLARSTPQSLPYDVCVRCVGMLEGPDAILEGGEAANINESAEKEEDWDDIGDIEEEPPPSATPDTNERLTVTTLGSLLVSLLSRQCNESPSNETMAMVASAAVASRPAVPVSERVFRNDAQLAELLLNAAYSWKDAAPEQGEGKALDFLWQAMESLPVQGKDWPAGLQQRVDDVERHLTAVHILSRYNVAPPLAVLRDAESALAPAEKAKELAHELLSAMCGAVVTDGISVDPLLEEAEDLRKRALPSLSRPLVLKSTLKAALAVGAFDVAQSIVLASTTVEVEDAEGAAGVLEQAAAEEAVETAVVEAARERFNAAPSLDAPGLAEAHRCIALLPFESAPAAAERRLQEAAAIAHRLGSEIVPLQLRLAFDGGGKDAVVSSNAVGGVITSSSVGLTNRILAVIDVILKTSPQAFMPLPTTSTVATYHRTEDTSEADEVGPGGALIQIARLLGLEDPSDLAVVRLKVASQALASGEVAPAVAVLSRVLAAAVKERSGRHHAKVLSSAKAGLPDGALDMLKRICEQVTPRSSRESIESVIKLCGSALCLASPQELAALADIWTTLPAGKDGDARALRHAVNTGTLGDDNDNMNITCVSALVDEMLLEAAGQHLSGEAKGRGDGRLGVAMAMAVSDVQAALGKLQEIAREVEQAAAAEAQTSVASAPAPTYVEPDDTIVEALHKRGFSRNGARRAAITTANAGLEPALLWCLNHSGDPDFDHPLPTRARRATGAETNGNASGSSRQLLAPHAPRAYAAIEVLARCEGDRFGRDKYDMALQDLVAAATGVLGSNMIVKLKGCDAETVESLRNALGRESSVASSSLKSVSAARLKEGEHHMSAINNQLSVAGAEGLGDGEVLEEEALEVGGHLSSEFGQDTWGPAMNRVLHALGVGWNSSLASGLPPSQCAAKAEAVVRTVLRKFSESESEKSDTESVPTLWSVVLRQPWRALQAIQSSYDLVDGTDLTRLELYLRLMRECASAMNSGASKEEDQNIYPKPEAIIAAEKRLQALEGLARRLLKGAAPPAFDFKAATGGSSAVWEAPDMSAVSHNAALALRASLDLTHLVPISKLAPRMGLTASAVHAIAATVVLCGGSDVPSEAVSVLKGDENLAGEREMSAASATVVSLVLPLLEKMAPADLLCVVEVGCVPLAVVAQAAAYLSLPEGRVLQPLSLTISQRARLVASALDTAEGSQNGAILAALTKLQLLMEALTLTPSHNRPNVEQLWRVGGVNGGDDVISSAVAALQSIVEGGVSSSTVVRQIATAVSQVIGVEGSELSLAALYASGARKQLKSMDLEPPYAVTAINTLKAMCKAATTGDPADTSTAWDAMHPLLFSYCTDTSAVTTAAGLRHRADLMSLLKDLKSMNGSRVEDIHVGGGEVSTPVPSVDALRTAGVISEYFGPMAGAAALEDGGNDGSWEERDALLEALEPQARIDPNACKGLCELLTLWEKTDSTSSPGSPPYHLRQQRLALAFSIPRLANTVLANESSAHDVGTAPSAKQSARRRVLSCISRSKAWPLLVAVAETGDEGEGQQWELQYLLKIGDAPPLPYVLAWALTSPNVTTHASAVAVVLGSLGRRGDEGLAVWEWSDTQLELLVGSPMLPELTAVPCYPAAVALILSHHHQGQRSVNTNIIRVAAVLCCGGQQSLAASLVMSALGTHSRLRTLDAGLCLLKLSFESALEEVLGGPSPPLPVPAEAMTDEWRLRFCQLLYRAIEAVTGQSIAAPVVEEAEEWKIEDDGW